PGGRGGLQLLGAGDQVDDVGGDRIMHASRDLGAPLRVGLHRIAAAAGEGYSRSQESHEENHCAHGVRPNADNIVTAATKSRTLFSVGALFAYGTTSGAKFKPIAARRRRGSRRLGPLKHFCASSIRSNASVLTRSYRRALSAPVAL